VVIRTQNCIVALIVAFALHQGQHGNAAEDNQPTGADVIAGRIFSCGFTYKDDKLQGMAVAIIDPNTGAWKRIVDRGAQFAVSPDGQTIVFEKEGALWNGDALTNANPGKVFHESGRAVFSPDSRSMLVTTYKTQADKPDAYEARPWKMSLDGTSAFEVAKLAGWNILDWSLDGKLLLVQDNKNNSLHVVQPDGENFRPLVKTADHAQFSPDGRTVAYVRQWAGKIRIVDTDGSNDRLFFESPSHILIPRFNPDGRHLAAVLQDKTLGADGIETLYADPKISHPRIAIFDAATGKQRILSLPQQEGWDFYPVNNLDWRK
jgi:Tol biopolymer transport system component